MPSLLDIGVPTGFFRRLGAMVYDLLLIIALVTLNVIVVISLTQKAVSGALFQSALFFEIFIFYSYFWVSRGQTLGMLAWKLLVVNKAGSGISPKEAMLRFIGGLLGILAGGVGIIWQLFDAHQRNWADLLSGTRIIHIPHRPI